MTPERLLELAAALQLPACVYDADEVADALRAYAALLEAKAPPEARGLHPLGVRSCDPDPHEWEHDGSSGDWCTRCFVLKRYLNTPK